MLKFASLDGHSLPSMLLIIITTCLCLPVYAGGKESGKKTVKTPEVVVSASRIPVSTHKVGSSVTVLTARDFENSRSTTVADVLRRTPGISISRTGSRGSITQARIRGAEGNHTLVILDGIKLNDPGRSSEFNFGNLLLRDIHKIEIVRGPQSALYGSDAIGGIIVITTKHAAGKRKKNGRNFNYSLEGGSYNTRSANASVNGRQNNWFYYASINWFKTDGFSSASELRGNTEQDGHENRTAQLGLIYKLNRRSRLSFTWRHTRADVDADGFTGGVGAVDSTNRDETTQDYGRIAWQHKSADKRWLHKASWSFMQSDVLTFSAFPFATHGKRYKLDYQVNYKFNGSANLDHNLTALIERETEQMSTTSSGGLLDSDRYGYVMEYRTDYKGTVFTSLGVRFDDNDRFRDADSYRFTLAYLVKKRKLRLHASVGTGIKNPTLFELFGSNAFFTGNPNLRQETSRGWDFGVEKKFGWKKLKLDLTYFDQKIDDLIVFSGGSVINVSGKSPSRGIELTWSLNPGKKWRLHGSLTWLDSVEASGERLVRRPKFKSVLGLLYRHSRKLNMVLDAVYKHDTVDYAFDASFVRSLVPLDDSLVINLNINWRLGKKTRLYFKVNNLLDDKYEEVFTYGTERRAYYLGFLQQY